MVNGITFSVESGDELMEIVELWNDIVEAGVNDDWEIVDTSTVLNYDFDSSVGVIDKELGLHFEMTEPDDYKEMSPELVIKVLEHISEYGLEE